MRSIIISILFLGLSQANFGQTFLGAYKKYRLQKADTLSNSSTKKKIKAFIHSQIRELDTVFRSYQSKHHFDFNKADTLFLIYDAPAESPFTSDIIIWSGKDTISYRQGFENKAPFKPHRIITYAPFITKGEHPPGWKLVTGRDSLVTLVSKRDYNIIEQLGDNQTIFDGSFVSIYVAYKEGKQYKFETCFPRQFILHPVYRKE